MELCNYEIIIHYQIRHPYYIIDENTKNLKDGTLFKSLEKVFKNLNMKYEFQDFPAARTVTSKIIWCIFTHDI
ncbi:hypothetical protein [Silvanigrella sp.]|jgi:hypothetical protein|uniref:hypothetical protein n=1 Tax=Silvanigrella sp. TaxID=2024976 RepID=UPI0037C821B4|nr:hypothetical protein [Silvanigrellaceae bacterium]